MNYEAMMEQQLCIRDLLNWPANYYPIIQDSTNNQFVQGMFEQDYGFTPMLLANQCAYVNWWLNSGKDHDDSRKTIALRYSDVRQVYGDISGVPEATASFVERQSAGLADAMNVGDINTLVEYNESNCTALSWTSAPDFVIPKDKLR